MEFIYQGENMQGDLHSFEYPNEILNGMLIDSNTTYAFLSDHVDSHRDLMEEITEIEGYYHHDMTNQDIDFDEAPHSWVIKSIGKLIIETAEAVLYQAGEE